MNAPAPAADKPVAAVHHHRVSLVAKFATKYSIDAEKLLTTLKATAFKVKEGEVSNEQMAALLVVADQYDLNPFTREIFAFPDKQNGIVPVVSVDGWTRIINEHPQMDGLEFNYSEQRVDPGDKRFPGLKWTAFEWIESVIHRKDRSRPVIVREFFEEVYRQPFKKGDYTIESAWQTHSKRFHRHKALIQGGRVAFGFAGIFDPDEAERILEGSFVEPMVDQQRRGSAGLKQAMLSGAANATDATVVEGAGADKAAGQQSQTTAGTAAAGSEGTATKTEEKKKQLGTLEQRDALIKKFGECNDVEILALARDGGREFEWSPADLEVIDVAYSQRQDALNEKEQKK